VETPFLLKGWTVLTDGGDSGTDFMELEIVQEDGVASRASRPACLLGTKISMILVKKISNTHPFDLKGSGNQVLPTNREVEQRN